ncbi:MAG: glycosyltransferase family 4 protein [Clostridia bacterium]
MILTVVNGYVSKKNMYTNGFVHAREKEYLRNGIDTMVYNLYTKNTPEDYEIEGVTVKVGNIKRLVKMVNNNPEITCVCFHFLTPGMIKALKKFKNRVNVVVFVHGNEALWWYQRIFPDRFNGFIRTIKFIKYLIINTISMMYIRKNINSIDNMNIVCVSEWMKKQAVRNWKIKTKVNVHIIPNVVNENIFPFIKKTSDQKFNFLMIRQFVSGKYALDIAMEIIKKLEEYPESNMFKFTIVGDGWLHEKYTKQIRDFKNVIFYKGFISQKEIAEYHMKNGFFLCPTRQDAQGVSMCEAMSSGLIPISSKNTAIPEFLPNEYNLSFTNVEQSVERIIEIVRDEELFQTLSKSCSDFIRNKCCSSKTIDKEIALMYKLEKK